MEKFCAKIEIEKTFGYRCKSMYEFFQKQPSIIFVFVEIKQITQFTKFLTDLLNTIKKLELDSLLKETNLHEEIAKYFPPTKI